MKTPIWCALVLPIVTLVSVSANPAIEKEVTTAINSWLQAMLTHDVALMNKLLHPSPENRVT